VKIAMDEAERLRRFRKFRVVAQTSSSALANSAAASAETNASTSRTPLSASALVG
jgi:hypothetical protein